MIQQTPPIRFGSVYVKMLSTHWLKCHDGKPPTKADRDDIRDEYVESDNKAGLLVSTNRGLFREEPTIYWHTPDMVNPLQKGAYNGLAIVLTNRDTELLNETDANAFKKCLNYKLGGEHAIVALDDSGEKLDLLCTGKKNKRFEKFELIGKESGELTTLLSIGENVFSKEARSRLNEAPES